MLNQQINGTFEKSYVDKLLAKDDASYIRNLIKKDNLTKSDLSEILNCLASTEIKLVNLSKWNWYVINKYFVWVREFVKILENMFDYEKNLDKNKINEKTKKVLEENKRIMINNVKFLSDLYLHLTRSTLSINGDAFNNLNSNKFDYQYSYPGQIGMNNEQKKDKGLFR